MRTQLCKLNHCHYGQC